MKKVFCIALVFTGVMAANYANATEKTKTPQQQKMVACHQQAGSQSLKGDARKAFMSQCLRRDSQSAGLTKQQLKMKNCNSQAGEQSLKGDARKKFMSQCLKEKGQF